MQREHDTLVKWLAEVPPRDAPRVLLAGSRYAIRNGPYPAWVALCERLLAWTAEPAVRSGALGRLFLVAHTAGDLGRAERAAKEWVELGRERGDEWEVALASEALADICVSRGQLGEALRIWQGEVLPVYERHGAVRNRAQTLGHIAEALRAQGQIDEALRIWQDEQIPIYEQIGEAGERAVTRSRIADVLQAHDQLDEALRIWQDEVLPVFEWLGDVRERAVTLSRIAGILRARGQLDEALRIWQDEVLPVYERLGEMLLVIVARINVALLYLLRGRPEDRPIAAHLLRLALAAAEAMGIPMAEEIRAVQRRYGLT
jgi:tetratricopeptide (TPR) repeat protein